VGWKAIREAQFAANAMQIETWHGYGLHSGCAKRQQSTQILKYSSHAIPELVILPSHRLQDGEEAAGSTADFVHQRENAAESRHGHPCIALLARQAHHAQQGNLHKLGAAGHTRYSVHYHCILHVAPFKSDANLPTDTRRPGAEPHLPDEPWLARACHRC
jgi:hypothetical protein